jgi:predicted DNA-binding transcriptional regulator AlpA
MNERMAAEAILDHLGALAEWLRVRAPGERHDLYVVGGAALALSGFSRTTYDVDVLRPATLPPNVREGARVVAWSRNLASAWLETGPAEIFRRVVRPVRFPDYFFESARVIEFGSNLVVEVAGRQALLSLKLYAAGPTTGKHLDDLRALTPDENEIREAIRFVLGVDGSEPRRRDLEIVIAGLGFEPRELTEGRR